MSAADGTVLVVDDDADIRDALSAMLEDEGYRVVAKSNGKEALDYLQKGAKPSLILLDLMMPVMDGWQFREAQRKDPELAEIPVIAISAANAGNIDVTRVLPKPLDVGVLLGLVARTAGPANASPAGDP